LYNIFILLQIFGTALLLICILAVTDPRNMQPTKGVTALSIGLVVVVIGMTFGLNCGYAINPARDLGPRIFTSIAGWGSNPFTLVLFLFLVNVQR
jgi:glycerol uptake facilitator-like aquaporin